MSALKHNGRIIAPLRRRTAKPVEIASAGKTVLIVDDDVMVLETVASVLRSAGYVSLVASTAQIAIRYAREFRDSIDLILLDAIMPDVRGASLYRELKEIASDFRIVGFSGASSEDLLPLRDAGIKEVLPKPLNSLALRDTVARFLSER